MRVEAPPPSAGGRLLHFRGQVQNPPADGAEALPDVTAPGQTGGPSPARVLALGRNVVPLAPRQRGTGPARRKLMVPGGTSRAGLAIALSCAAVALVGMGAGSYTGVLKDGIHTDQVHADQAHATRATTTRATTDLPLPPHHPPLLSPPRSRRQRPTGCARRSTGPCSAATTWPPQRRSATSPALPEGPAGWRPTASPCRTPPGAPEPRRRLSCYPTLRRETRLSESGASASILRTARSSSAWRTSADLCRLRATLAIVVPSS